MSDIIDRRNPSNTAGVSYTPCVKAAYHGPTNSRGSRVILSLPNHDSKERLPITFGYDYGINGVENMAINWLVKAGFFVTGYTADKDSWFILVDWHGQEVDALWENLKKVSKHES